MKTLVFGSCNLDYTYQVPRIVTPGETLPVRAVSLNPGGKGVNQSVALKKAGLDVWFAGCRGADGAALQAVLAENGVDTGFLRTVETPSGAACIQVTDTGENAILLFHGANHAVTPQMIDETLSHFGPGDLLVMQNEVSSLSYLIREGARRGMRLVLNPSPFDAAMREIDYGSIWLVFINEVEFAGLAAGRDMDTFMADMRRRYPDTRWVVTFGAQGSLYFDKESCFRQPAFSVNAVDTTCAGDTFTGFFTAALTRGAPIPTCLLQATAASAVTVSRVGAAGVIPTPDEVQNLINGTSPR